MADPEVASAQKTMAAASQTESCPLQERESVNVGGPAAAHRGAGASPPAKASHARRGATACAGLVGLSILTISAVAGYSMAGAGECVSSAGGSCTSSASCTCSGDTLSYKATFSLSHGGGSCFACSAPPVCTSDEGSCTSNPDCGCGAMTRATLTMSSGGTCYACRPPPPPPPGISEAVQFECADTFPASFYNPEGWQTYCAIYDSPGASAYAFAMPLDCGGYAYAGADGYSPPEGYFIFDVGGGKCNACSTVEGQCTDGETPALIQTPPKPCAQSLPSPQPTEGAAQSL